MTTSQKPPISFWVISIVALIWNTMGVLAYIGQAFLTEEAIAAMPPEQQEIYRIEVPAWYTAAFAIAVSAGFGACILLLLRKKLANILFITSFIAVIVQSIYTFFMSPITDKMSGFDTGMSISIPIVAILLIIFSNKGIAKGWLK